MDPIYTQTEMSTALRQKKERKLDKSIDLITIGLSPYFRSILIQMASSNSENAELLLDFLYLESNNGSIKTSTLETRIKIIWWFDRFAGHKAFSEVTRDDLVTYFASLRKGEQEDPTHRWIGTHNTRHIILSKFFKWLYNQNEPDSKKWIVPPCLHAIKPLLRKERSPYKPSDIWTNEEHALFLKYCPEKRDRCYHAMANDTSARPHELLSLKMKDIVFKKSSTGLQYAEVYISQTKTRPRAVPLIFSIPYVKDWIDAHPLAGNSECFLFISLADSNFGERLHENALYKIYTRHYKNRHFRKLLEDPLIPEAEKSHIRNMLTKPWCPYIFRHSALTAKSQILKESTLREHAGWSMTSRMPNIYIHYFGNESSKSLLEAYGIESYNQEQINILKSIICPNCSEPCKPNARFCPTCKMVLTYDAYNKTLEDHRENEEKLNKMEVKFNTIQTQIETLISIFSSMNTQEGKQEIARELILKGAYRNMNETAKVD